MKKIKCNCRLTDKQRDKLERLMTITAETFMGGKDSVAYELLGSCCREEMEDDLCEYFVIEKLSDIKPYFYGEVVKYLCGWEPSAELMDVSLDVEEGFKNYCYKYIDELPTESEAYKTFKEDYINALCTGSERLN